MGFNVDWLALALNGEAGVLPLAPVAPRPAMLFWPGVVLDEDLVETRVDILRITERNYSKSKSKAERKDHTARWYSRTVGKPKVMAVREEGESLA